MTQGWYDRLVGEWGTAVTDRYMERVMAWSDANGKETKDYAARAATFIARDVEAGKLAKPKGTVIKGFAERRREAFGE